MRIIENPERERKLIENCIKKYGHTPDHNFDWLLYCADEGEPRVAVWDGDYAVGCYQNNDNWIVVSDPVAPADKYRVILTELTTHLLNSGANKIKFLDVRDAVNNIVRNLYPDEYKFDYDIVWPVVDMSSFDPELPGGHFKDIRNALNKFNREHQANISPAHLVDPERNREGSQRASVSYGIDKKEIHGIVDRWMDDRTKAGIEEPYPGRYHNMIDGNFKGTDNARVMFIDGKAVGFNAGWTTPNKPTEWSAAIGIHDFSVKDLGIMLLMEDLKWIKNVGYKTCDLEGSDPQALKFKTQFFPNGYRSYKTYTFRINK